MTESTARNISKYGWRPDLPDSRDFLYAAPRLALAQLPATVDLKAQCPAVYDQGRIGSCTANAIAAAFEFNLVKQQLPDFAPSRLFIYYNERAREGHIGSDAGAQIRDGIRSVNKQGVCPETEWPYDDTPADEETGAWPVGATPRKRPTTACYHDALQHRSTTYQRVIRTLEQFKGCLAAGYPFVFGFTVYTSFESPEVAKTGVVPLPDLDEDILGGHAVLAVGYDDESQRFLVRNSLGPTWGNEGYFTMPYTYLTEHGLSSDFWTLRIVT
jgi:C1A family cysteine protease